MSTLASRRKLLNALRVWQIAFLVGACSCILSVIIVLGNGVFTTVAALFAVVVAVLNSLLTPTGPVQPREKWVISKLKSALNLSPYLKLATVVVWGTTFGLVGFGIANIYFAAQKISISGYVQDAQGNPIDDAFVTMVLGSIRRTTVTSRGKFEFSEVSIGSQPSKKILIETIWKNRRTKTSLELTRVFANPVLIKLPPGDPPFRIIYYTIGGNAVDFLVNGTIDKKWETTLGGQPFIVPNHVFNALRLLVHDFAHSNYEDYLHTELAPTFFVEPQKPDDESTEVEADPKRPFFVGSEPGFMVSELSNEYIASISKPDIWNILVTGSKSMVESSGSEFFVWKFANEADIQKVLGKRFQDDTWYRFYKHVTKDYRPDDSCLLYSYYNECDLTPLLFLQSRTIKVRVAVIENITSSPININEFSIKSNQVERLRSRDEDQLSLNSIEPERPDWFPLRILKPGERLLIPIEVLFVHDPQEFFFESLLGSDSQERRDSLAANLSNRRERFPIHIGNKQIDIEPGALLEMLGRGKPDSMLKTDYVVGPSVLLEGVQIGGVDYVFRTYDEKQFVISNAIEAGSCPFVYTYSSIGRSWLKEGHLLYGLNSKHKEAVSEISLKRFDGRIQIREVEPEISFLDFLYVKAVGLDGSVKVLYPKNHLLASEDGEYLKMTKGTKLELRFDFRPDLKRFRLYLVAKGYYIPDLSANGRIRSSLR